MSASLLKHRPTTDRVRTAAVALIALIGPAVAVGVPSGAWAAPITMYFQGTFDTVNDPSKLIGGLGIGSSFSGSFAFDPAAATPGSAFPGIVFYDVNPAGSIAGTVAGSNFSQGSHTVTIADDFDDPGTPVVETADLWGTGVTFDPAMPPNPLGSLIVGDHAVFIAFRDLSGNAISSTNFFVPGSVAGWADPRFEISSVEQGLNLPIISGQITLVPEPSTALLVGVGLCMLRSRRRQRTHGRP